MKVVQFSCFFCHSELHWDSDTDASDYYDDEKYKDATLMFFHRPECGAEYEVTRL